MIKTCRFWLTAVAFFMVVANATGGDDYGLLMMISNPMYWLNETTFVNTSDNVILRWVSYPLTVAFWFFVGFGIDRLLKRKDK